MKLYLVWDCDDIVGVFDSLEKAEDCIKKVAAVVEDKVDFNNFEDYSTEHLERHYLGTNYQITKYPLNGIGKAWLQYDPY